MSDNWGNEFCNEVQKRKKVEELEAQKNPPHILTLMQQVDELEANHTALVEGLRGLAEKWVTEDDECDTEYRNGYDDGKEWCAAALLALLGKESGDA